MNTIGQRLRYAMALRSIRTNELDARIGLGSGYTSRLARDRKARPDVHIVSKIAVELGVDLDWLVTGRGSPPSGPMVDVTLPLSAYPEWAEELERARRHYRSIPEEYFAKAGESTLPGTRPTWEVIGRVAQILWDTSAANDKDRSA